jgi:integrase/recombinase XerD
VSRPAETYKKLAPGIYAVFHGRKKVGVRAMVRVKGKLYSHRWKSPDTTPTVAKQWQEDTRVEIRKTPATPKAHAPEGFAADAARYLKAVAAMTTYSDRKRDVDAWIAVFGNQPRRTITSADIAEQLAGWRKAGASASVVNHRRTALMHLWRVLDGKSAANPVRDIPKYPEPEAEARGIDYAVIRAIFDAMPDTVHKARLEVIAYTGLPHATIQRLTAKDIDLQAGVLVRPGRHKGKGTRRQTIPLTADGVRALRAMIEHKGLTEPFSRYVMYGEFKRARKRVEAALQIDLSGVRPYDLRHSFGTELYRLTGDQRAVQAMLGHAKIETTHRYTLGGVDARLQAVVQAFNATKSPAEVSPRRNSEGNLEAH